MILILVLMLMDVDAEGLRRTAPHDLTVESARDHWLAAVGAAATQHLWEGAEYDLLAIAHHESRYTPTAVTDEGAGWWWAAYDHRARWSNRRVSCGVMTPQPKPTCEPRELTIAGGYLHGAQHLAEWAWRCRLAGSWDVRVCALGGYSGWMMDDQRGNAGLRAWQVFYHRAERIKTSVRRYRRENV